MSTPDPDAQGRADPTGDGRRGPRLIVGVHGSVGSLQALRHAVAEARRRDIDLWSVLVWMPPGGDLPRGGTAAAERALARHHLDHLREAWERAFGGVPRDRLVTLLVTRGAPAPTLTALASRPDDLLVVGAPARNPLRRFLDGSTVHHCLRGATCPVTVVPAPPLSAALGGRRRTRRQARRFVDHLRADAPTIH